MISLVLLTSFLFISSKAFSSHHAISSRSATSLPMNFFSGVTGIPPSSLLQDTWKNSLVDQTSLEGVDLECAYKASRDGWSAIDFHEAVDERGSGLVIALSRTGATFGGFNPVGWRSTDDYCSSNAAFLWFVKGQQVVKCPILQGGNAAIFDYATGGPCFGAADMKIGSPQAAVMGGFAGPDMLDSTVNAGNLREGESSIGGAYDSVAGWPARGNFQLAEVEVYCNADIKPGGSSSGSWWPF